MPGTMSQKILARAAGRATVSVGGLVPFMKARLQATAAPAVR